jgi:hypothetical protein
MTKAKKYIKGYFSNPRYTLMRAMARFPVIRLLIVSLCRFLTFSKTQRFISSCIKNKEKTIFTDVDWESFYRDLTSNGVAFGLKLPDQIVDRIIRLTNDELCYADREVSLGFKVADRLMAESSIGKPILLAQYFNVIDNCPDIQKIKDDPLLQWVAAKYLGTTPAFVGVNLWWTFPVNAQEEDRQKHAHVFHRDIDDFKFLKFFFYITKVPKNEGAHICVATSNLHPPDIRAGDRYRTRRYTDHEISSYYSTEKILEIFGESGEGFAEDTLCLHKGSTPKKIPRLLLQLQFAIFDYGNMHDQRKVSALGKVLK